MTIVLDTNILVSALLSPLGAPAKVLDLVLAGEVSLAVDERLLSEYQEVLVRPRFGFDAGDVATLLAFIEQEAEQVAAASLNVTLPDPDDVMFLEVAATAGATLVTGNLRHYPTDQRGGVRVIPPAAFLAEREGEV